MGEELSCSEAKGQLHGNKSARKQSFDRSRPSEGQRLAAIDWGSDSDHIEQLPLKYSRNHPSSGGRSVVSAETATRMNTNTL